MNTNQRFKALSRICLNNWHYIDHRTLSFNEGINFFTGHSGSGKSTIIDAMQIVLYADTDGRGFFNKAAADDSDRNLIEYLRGMVNIEDNNNFSYLRNSNFSSTIVLEFQQTGNGEKQCVGVVFDVETAANERRHMFFWHKGPLLGHEYRTSSRTMTIEEVRDYLNNNFTGEEYFCGSHNERFRGLLYETYLGGLDKNKFPMLFKRAIPFRMNIKLEDFVKEYICTEQNIHIEDMQESVMQYGRMRRKIQDTFEEIQQLEQIQEKFACVEEIRKEQGLCQYAADKLEILEWTQQIHTLIYDIQNSEKELEGQEKEEVRLKEKIQQMEKSRDELLKKISATGYDEIKSQLVSLNELIEQLLRNKGRWERTGEALKKWEEEDCTPNQTLWDIESFVKKNISQGEIKRLKQGLAELKKETEGQRRDAEAEIRFLERREKELTNDLKLLKGGKKTYPKELEEAKSYLQRRLYEETKKSVSVEILADLLDIGSEQWRNAVEGYLGNNKLALMVEPKYARTAMKIYGELDRKKYFRVAVVDTERVCADKHTVLKSALAEEVIAYSDYVQAYIHFLLGKVIKCENIDELRREKIGITSDCLLYHSYRLQYINPEYYTKRAYIGAASMKKRIGQIEKEIKEIQENKLPYIQIKKDCDRVLALEYLSLSEEEYSNWKLDMERCVEKERDKKQLEKKLAELDSGQVSQWTREREELKEEIDASSKLKDNVSQTIWRLQVEIEKKKENNIALNHQLEERKGQFKEEEDGELRVKEILESNQKNLKKADVINVLRYDKLKENCRRKAEEAAQKQEEAFEKLVEQRALYLQQHPERAVSLKTKDNQAYDQLLSQLQCDQLEAYKERAEEQARAAVIHFKEDFVYKIRTAIKEALIRKDELNKIISSLDFGKDKYQFVIGRSKGPDSQYYDMLMDEDLDINPSSLNKSMENQMNLFTMSHEEKYGVMLNELIQIFIPPEGATLEQQEEARRQMERYADYRTYLSFDMQQIIEGEETMKIPLSRMIRKNSGGEGQNPFYVALLASFAQAYRINLSPKLEREPTMRLVVLDEAFSKMDGEKVASCIRLIRGLGFQAIISATNDKIQNYLENVDKTFVFANPNKKHISVQEFEKRQFEQLSEEAGEWD